MMATLVEFANTFGVRSPSSCPTQGRKPWAPISQRLRRKPPGTKATKSEYALLV